MSDIHKLTGAYALDAVDDLERARFEQHLAECDDCRAEVAELRETAALLAEMTLTPPPASLRASVLASIAEVRPLPPLTPPQPEPSDVRQPPAAAVRRRPWLLLVAAAAVVVAGLGVAAWQPWAEEQAPRLTAAERVLQAEDAQRVSVDLGELGRATVVRSVEEDRAVLITEDMVAPPEGKVFEVWLQSPEGEMEPAGLMPEKPDQTLLLDGEAAAATGAGITVEPEGGSDAPTSEPIVVFDFSEAT